MGGNAEEDGGRWHARYTWSTPVRLTTSWRVENQGRSIYGDPAVRAGRTMPLAWIAERLRMGSRGYLTWLLHRQGKPA
jgi:hypothetical protein